MGRIPCKRLHKACSTTRGPRRIFPTKEVKQSGRYSLTYARGTRGRSQKDETCQKFPFPLIPYENSTNTQQNPPQDGVFESRGKVRSNAALLVACNRPWVPQFTFSSTTRPFFGQKSPTALVSRTSQIGKSSYRRVR